MGSGTNPAARWASAESAPNSGSNGTPDRAVTSVVVARSYELKVVTPTLTPGAGAYGSSQSVSIATTTSGATPSW